MTSKTNRKNKIYIIGTCQPILKNVDNDLNKRFLNKEDKYEVITDFYSTKTHSPSSLPPICIGNHANGHMYGYGFVVPESERTGKVLDLLTDEKGHYIIIAEIDITKETEHVIKGLKEGNKIGLSVAIDGITYPSGTQYKKLTHVAVLKDAAFIEEGSYIHHWGNTIGAVDKRIKSEYFSEGKEDCYAHPSVKHRWCNEEKEEGGEDEDNITSIVVDEESLEGMYLIIILLLFNYLLCFYI